MRVDFLKIVSLSKLLEVGRGFCDRHSVLCVSWDSPETALWQVARTAPSHWVFVFKMFSIVGASHLATRHSTATGTVSALRAPCKRGRPMIIDREIEVVWLHDVFVSFVDAVSFTSIEDCVGPRWQLSVARSRRGRCRLEASFQFMMGGLACIFLA